MIPPSGCPSRVVGRRYGDYFFVGGEEGLEPVQTLVPIAANGGKDLEVIDAASCNFYIEGRNRTFAAQSIEVGSA